MEVKPGYKMTELGVIPADWDTKFLREVADFSNGKPHEKHITSDGRFCLITLDSIDIHGELKDQHKETDVWDGSLRKNDLVTVLSDLAHGNLLGLCGVIPEDDKYVLNQRMGRLRLKVDADPRFIRLQINRRQHHFKNRGQGTSQRHIYRRDFDVLQIPFASASEQRTIADTLRDADLLVEALEQLIAKKRDIKQATMQQLLTGKTRLRGYVEAWEEKSLSELFEFSGGFTASRDQLSPDKGICYLHYGDIHSSAKTFIDVSSEFTKIPKLEIDLKRIGSGPLLRDGDVVFVDASEDDEGTSKHVVVRNKTNIPFISGLHTIVAKRKSDELDAVFLGYCFQTSAIQQQFKYYAVGTKVKGVNKTTIKSIKLRFPAIKEQAEIAMILSDMDSEIEQLRARLVKTRGIKLGMMQQLLTGKVRLV